jgi:hypothetical protein
MIPLGLRLGADAPYAEDAHVQQTSVARNVAALG